MSQEPHNASSMTRNEFLARSGGFAFGTATLGALLSACGSSSTGASSGSSSTTTTGSLPRVPTGSAHVAVGANIITLNPANALDLASISAATNIYAGLVEEGDGPGKLSPGLATSITDLGGATKWRIALRDDVLFQDNTKIDGDAVKTNLDFYKKGAFPYSALLGDYRRATVVNPTTVEVELGAPNADFPLAMLILRMISPATLAKGAKAIEANPIGSGPFRFVSRSEEKLSMTAFPAYRGGGPYLKNVDFPVITELGTRLNAIQNGQVQLVQQIPPLQVAQLQGNSSVDLQTFDTYVIANLFLKADQAPLHNADVRRAIWYSIDRASIVKDILRGQASVATDFVPEGVDGFVPSSDPYPFDPEKAKSLVRGANAEGANLVIPVPEGAVVLGPEVGEAIAAQIRVSGLNAQARVVPTSLFQAAFGGNVHFPTALFQSTWVSGSAFQITQQFFGSYAGQPQLKVLEKRTATSVGAARTAAVTAVNDFNAKSVFSVPLYRLKQTDATRGLNGYTAHGNGVLHLATASLAS